VLATHRRVRDDMGKWRTGQALHVLVQMRRAPGKKVSAAAYSSSRRGRSANRAPRWPRIGAVNIGRPQTALGAFYQRLAARIGKAKAVTGPRAGKLAIPLL